MLFSQVFCFPLQNLQKYSIIPIVDSNPSVSRRFRELQDWYYPLGQDEILLEKNCIILYLFSDKLSY